VPTFADLATDTFGWKLLFLLHLLCVTVGFGSTFVYPLLGKIASERTAAEGTVLTDAALYAAKRVTTPVIYAAGFFGLVLAIVGPYDMGKAWIAIAIVLFAAAVVFAGFVHVPNLVAMNKLSHQLSDAGPPPAGVAPSGPPPQVAQIEARGKRAAMNGGILHLVFLLLMLDMIWKPGA
jgi:hypothetical protein